MTPNWGLLDEDSRAFLQRIRDAMPNPPLDARALRLAERATLPDPALHRAGLHAVEDIAIPGPGGALTLRRYQPPHPTGGALVFFHGGGFVLGDLDTHDLLCSALALQSGCPVIAVRYRLAPENKAPAAVHDAYAATVWVAQNAAALHIDPARIAVGGDSAGGNLAANVTLMARDRGGPAIAFQMLLYPVTHRASQTASEIEFAEGFLLTARLMRWFKTQYLPSTEPDFRYDGPFEAPDHCNLPPALIITAGYDPLRDQGMQYAAALRQAGNQVTERCYAGTIHGFMQYADRIAQGRDAIAFAGQELAQALRPDVSPPRTA